MISCEFAGGLGNNLFQFANIYNLHKKYCLDYIIKKDFLRLSFDGKPLSEDKRFNQETNLEIPFLFDNDFNYFDPTIHNLDNFSIYKHRDIAYNNHRYKELEKKDNLIYKGYFQSFKYHDSFDPTWRNIIQERVDQLAVAA